MIRVLVADDHLAVREGVRTLLANEGEITIVGQAGDGSTALSLARVLRLRVLRQDGGGAHFGRELGTLRCGGHPGSLGSLVRLTVVRRLRLGDVVEAGRRVGSPS